MAGAFYFMISYSGPFKWLAELQLKLMGMYEESITFLIVALILICPLLLIDWLIRRVSGTAIGSADDATERKTPLWMSVASAMGFGGIVACVGLLLMGVGTWQWWQGRDTTVARVDVRDYEIGKPPPNRFVQVQGVAVFESAVEIQESRSSDVDFYVPIISLDWKDKSPASVFVKVRESKLTDSLRASRHDWFGGMISRGGLPGLVRTEFENRGPAPAEGYFLLELDRSAAGQRKLSRDALLFGGALLAAGVVISIVQARGRLRELSASRSLDTTPTGHDPRFAIKSFQNTRSSADAEAAPDDGNK